MSKYLNIQQDLFSIFDSDAWKATGLKTIPCNFMPPNLGTEFIRVSVLTDNGLNLVCAKGLFIVDIFVLAGSGPTRISEIADQLDTHFVGKSFTTISDRVTQCFQSSLTQGKADIDNTTLFRATYNLNFKYYGVNQ